MSRQEILISDVFQSPTFGRVNFDDVMTLLLRYISNEPNKQYRIVVGTDSTMERDGAEFVSAIVIHRVGSGGVYFWNGAHIPKRFVLRDRMYQEALRSLLVAQKLVMELKNRHFLEYEMEIHVDIGQNGDTRDMIQEVVGMIRGSGFTVRTKPDAYAASKVADRHT